MTARPMEACTQSRPTSGNERESEVEELQNKKTLALSQNMSAFRSSLSWTAPILGPLGYAKEQDKRELARGLCL